MIKNKILALAGCSFGELLIEFFEDNYMGAISKEHHKNNDGALELYYNWYYDNPHQFAYEIYHPGYIRGDIRGIGHTLQEAIDNFIVAWAESYEGWDFDPYEGVKDE